MKTYKILLNVLFFSASPLLISMEAPIKEQPQEIEYAAASLGGLPPELKAQIIAAITSAEESEKSFQEWYQANKKTLPSFINPQIIKSNRTLESIGKSIQALGNVNKEFYRLINDPQITSTLIKLLADRFIFGNRIISAFALHTPGARQWFKSQEAKKWFKNLSEPFKQHIAGDAIFSMLGPVGIKPYLEIGLDPNSTTPEGASLLSEAARFGKPNIVKTLIDLGADVNKGHLELRRTPLMGAIPQLPLGKDRQDVLKVIQLLLDAGADPNIIDITGKNAFDRAREYKQFEILKILEEHLAKQRK